MPSSTSPPSSGPASTALREGQKVEFELVPGRNGKTSAENLVALD